MYRGKVYTVSCRDLGTHDSKEASYREANAWWERKKAEIDLHSTRPARPHGDILDDLELRRDVAIDVGATPEAEELGQVIALVQAMEDEPREEVVRALHDIEVFDETFPDDRTADRIEAARRAGIVIPDGVDPRVIGYIFGDVRERLRRDYERHLPGHEKRIPEERAVASQVDRYVGLEKARVEGGHVSVGEYEIVKRALDDFKGWIGGGTGIEAIDAEKLDEWWSHLLGLKVSVETKKKKLRHVRSFVGWLADKGAIARPTNLHSRRHRFGGGLKEITTVSPKELKGLVENAPGQLKLHLLLMANCGMTQIDINDLQPGEIDWDAGRVRRKRSKTSDHKNVPVVDYPLWPVTADLLRHYGHRKGEHALLTGSGLPWVRDVLKADGKRSKVDNIKSNFAHVKRRLGLKFSMKAIRKTSASLLESEAEHARYAIMFLGHSPRSIADRHYIAPDPAGFDRAVLWLGRKYGFVEQPAGSVGT